MPNRYIQSPASKSATRFSNAPMSEVEHSIVDQSCELLTTMNAGDIVPIFFKEILPGESLSISVDEVIRQATLLTPTMGEAFIDIVAYFVPNRCVNESWKNVMGENTSGFWTAPEVDLAPLYDEFDAPGTLQIPVGSVADYYGLPTQAGIPYSVLNAMNDFAFRGYLAIYNEYWRSQDYQAPIPFSKLNIYEGFLLEKGSRLDSISLPTGIVSDGSNPGGAVTEAVFGEGSALGGDGTGAYINRPVTSWSALDAPLKANKLHDYFTAVLPSPSKGGDVHFNLAGSAPVAPSYGSSSGFPLDGLRLYTAGASGSGIKNNLVVSREDTSDPTGPWALGLDSQVAAGPSEPVVGSNLELNADLSEVSAISLSELRLGAAVQRTYETLARSGSRLREFISGFFGVEAVDMYPEVPKRLGRIRRSLDIYQTAQTSPSAEGSTPQGNLAAFGYSAHGGDLFHETFIEHGYVHVLACIRHRNIYPAYVDRFWFRKTFLDFYNPQLSNLSEQPVYTREINPFADDSALPGTYQPKVFGYQEAWAEYRYTPSRTSAYQRPGIDGSLAVWNYADDFDSSLVIAEGNWLKSNTQDVVDRTLAVTSKQAPQFKAQFKFSIKDELPMPTYDIPGLDII